MPPEPIGFIWVILFIASFVVMICAGAIGEQQQESKWPPIIMVLAFISLAASGWVVS